MINTEHVGQNGGQGLWTPDMSRRDFCERSGKAAAFLLLDPSIIQARANLLGNLIRPLSAAYTRRILQAQGWEFAAFVPNQSEQFFPFIDYGLINQPTMQQANGAAAIHDRERGTNLQAQAQAWADEYYRLYINPETTVLTDWATGERKPLDWIHAKSSGDCGTLNGAFARGKKDPGHAIGRGAIIMEYSGYKLYKPSTDLSERIEILSSEMITSGMPYVIERNGDPEQGDEFGFLTHAVYGVNWRDRLLMATNNGEMGLGGFGVAIISMDAAAGRVYDAYRLVAPDEESSYPDGTLFPVIDDPVLEALYVFRGFDPELILRMQNGEVN